MDQPSPSGASDRQSLRDVVLKFGFPIEKFTPGQGKLKAARISAVLLMIAGALCAAWAGPKTSNPIWYGVGGTLFGVGVGLVLFAQQIGRGMRVLVCPRGLVIVRQHGQVDTCEWSQVKEIREQGTNLVVDRHEGTPLEFTEENLPAVRRFAQVLRQEADRRRIIWKTESAPPAVP